MEINVVFTHELVKAYVVGIQPPLFPFRCITGSDTWVSNAGVELEWGVISRFLMQYWPVLTQTSKRVRSEGYITTTIRTPYRGPSPSFHTDPFRLGAEPEHPKSSLELQGSGAIHSLVVHRQSLPLC